MPRKIDVWEPSPETAAAMPDLDGNAWNGLGDPDVKQPKPFFWHDAALHPWAGMQYHTLGIMFGHPEEGPQIAQAFAVGERPGTFQQRGPEPNTVAPHQENKTAPEWTATLKEFGLANGADDIGIAVLQPEWVFEGYSIPYKYIISIAVAHDYEEIAEAPSELGNPRAIIEVGVQYTRGAATANRVRNFIRDQGYDAESYEGPMGGALLMIPAAIAGGLGELGKHHSIIHPKFGSSFRLAAVGTNMPLVPDEPVVFGGDDFCQSCQLCTDNCPPAAISDDKQMVRGVEKWYVDFEKCMPYFAEARGCTLCLAVCPWSRPGVADGLLKKMARRRKA
ncbi:MAG: reductive dehalogenase domain-containing protein [Pseudomonadota bacterium]